MQQYIKQSSIGLLSRSLVNSNISDINGGSYLPLITAPMTSVINESIINKFLHKQIQVCLPRVNNNEFGISSNYFYSCSINSFNEFILNGLYDDFIKNSELPLKICIDTANGNNPKLHESIRKAKLRFSDKLIIMSGNVSSVEAFIELAKTGCDYIRVGIGGGAGCNTSKNTFIGQNNLSDLIYACYQAKKSCHDIRRELYISGNRHKINYCGHIFDVNNKPNFENVKIVADGISSYIDLTVKENMAYDNGYGAIINLLYSGADLIMIGKLFAQSLESAGTKVIKSLNSKGAYIKANPDIQINLAKEKNLVVEYYGMSTKKAQLEYSENTIETTKHSEGKSVFLPVRWTLDEWLNGSETDSDFLPGFVNCLKSAMSYTGSIELNKFKMK
jgi:hypothetical protein